MKKIAAILLLTLLAANALCATKSKNEQFLSRLSRQYYNLQRAGLKNFQCEVTSEKMLEMKTLAAMKFGLDSPVIKELENFRYAIQYRGRKAFTVKPPRIELTGEQKFDILITKQKDAHQKLIEIIVDLWNILSDPFADDTSEPATQIDKVTKTANGYEVTWKEKGKHITVNVDNDFRVTGMVAMSDKGKTEMALRTDYKKTAKGWRISSWEIVEGDSATTFEMTYRTVNGIEVPDQVALSITVTGEKEGTHEDTLTFDNYAVNR